MSVAGISQIRHSGKLSSPDLQTLPSWAKFYPFEPRCLRKARLMRHRLNFSNPTFLHLDDKAGWPAEYCVIDEDYVDDVRWPFPQIVLTLIFDVLSSGST